MLRQPSAGCGASIASRGSCRLSFVPSPRGQRGRGASGQRFGLVLPSNPHVRCGAFQGTEGHLYAWRDGSKAGSGAQPVQQPQAELPRLELELLALPPRNMRRCILAACTIVAAAAAAAQRTAGSYRNPTWGKKLGYFAGSCSPDGEAPAPRGETTYVWGLLLFVVAFNVACFVATRDDDVLRDTTEVLRDIRRARYEDEPGLTGESLDALFEEEDVLPATASKLTRLADRCDWNAWNLATITGDYDPDHTTLPRWRAQGRAAIIRGTAEKMGIDEAEVRRRAARYGFWGEAFERDVALAEIN